MPDNQLNVDIIAKLSGDSQRLLERFAKLERLRIAVEFDQKSGKTLSTLQDIRDLTAKSLSLTLNTAPFINNVRQAAKAFDDTMGTSIKNAQNNINSLYSSLDPKNISRRLGGSAQQPLTTNYPFGPTPVRSILNQGTAVPIAKSFPAFRGLQYNPPPGGNPPGSNPPFGPNPPGPNPPPGGGNPFYGGPIGPNQPPNPRLIDELASDIRSGRLTSVQSGRVSTAQLNAARQFVEQNQAGQGNFAIANRLRLARLDIARAQRLKSIGGTLLSDLEQGRIGINDFENRINVLTAPNGPIGSGSAVVNDQIQNLLNRGQSIVQKQDREVIAADRRANTYSRVETLLYGPRVQARRIGEEKNFTQRQIQALETRLASQRRFDPSRLSSQESLIQLGFAGLFGGIPGLAGAAAGGGYLGAPGVFIGSAISQRLSGIITTMFSTIATNLSVVAQAGLEFQKSIIGIASVFQSTTEVIGRGGKTLDIPQQLAFQQQRARGLQVAGRRRLAPLGISGQSEVALIRAVTAGSARRGGLSNEAILDLSEGIGAAAQALTPEILQNPSILSRDIRDIIAGSPQAGRTQLGAALGPDLIKQISTATTAEDLKKVNDALQNFVQTLKETGEASVSLQKISAGMQNSITSIGDAFLRGLEPALKKLADTLAKPEAQQGINRLAEVLGSAAEAISGIVIKTIDVLGSLPDPLKNKILGGLGFAGTLATGGPVGVVAKSITDTFFPRDDRFSIVKKNVEVGDTAANKIELENLKRQRELIPTFDIQKKKKLDDRIAILEATFKPKPPNLTPEEAIKTLKETTDKSSIFGGDLEASFGAASTFEDLKKLRVKPEIAEKIAQGQLASGKLDNALRSAGKIGDLAQLGIFPNEFRSTEGQDFISNTIRTLNEGLQHLTDTVNKANRSFEDLQEDLELQRLGRTGKAVSAAEKILQLGGSETELPFGVPKDLVKGSSSFSPEARRLFELSQARAEGSIAEREFGLDRTFTEEGEEFRQRKFGIDQAKAARITGGLQQISTLIDVFKTFAGTPLGDALKPILGQQIPNLSEFLRGSVEGNEFVGPSKFDAVLPSTDILDKIENSAKAQQQLTVDINKISDKMDQIITNIQGAANSIVKELDL